MTFRRFLQDMRPLSYYVLTRGLLLSCALLLSALAVLAAADSGTGALHLLRAYAAYTVDMAAVVLGAGLIGSLLLEDVLIHRT